MVFLERLTVVAESQTFFRKTFCLARLHPMSHKYMCHPVQAISASVAYNNFSMNRVVHIRLWKINIAHATWGWGINSVYHQKIAFFIHIELETSTLSMLGALLKQGLEGFSFNIFLIRCGDGFYYILIYWLSCLAFPKTH